MLANLLVVVNGVFDIITGIFIWRTCCSNNFVDGRVPIRAFSQLLFSFTADFEFVKLYEIRFLWNANGVTKRRFLAYSICSTACTSAIVFLLLSVSSLTPEQFSLILWNI